MESLKEIPHFSHTQATIHAIAKILAKARREIELKALVDAINSGRFRNVFSVSNMDRMQWHALCGDIDSVLLAWDDMKSMKRNPNLCSESYNIVMGVYAQMGKNLEAVKIFQNMIDEGAIPNCRTYTVIIKHLADSGNLDSAIEVFNILPSMRMKRTLRQYSLLVDGFIIIERFDIVKNLFKEMNIDGILPGRAMLSSLKRMYEAGFVEETQDFLKEMLPNERIKNVVYSIDAGDDDDDDDDDNDNDNSEDKDENDDDNVQLKPWLDPHALASSLRYWRPEEVSVLESANIVWTTRLVCKMIRSFKSVETAWKFFSWVSYQKGGFSHDIYTVSRMIVKLARDGRAELVNELISKLRRERINLSFSTVRLIIDFYGLSKNGGAALEIFNDVEELCGPISKCNVLLLYSSLIRTMAKCGRNQDAFDKLEEMILHEIIPDVQIFSGLMHHFARIGDFKMVHKLFGMVRQSGIQVDAYMYKVIISGYCKCARASLALRVFQDMINSNLMLDLGTKRLLVKSLWKEGKLREAAYVEERSEQASDVLPLKLSGQPFTVTCFDLNRVYNIYSSCFKTD